MLGTENYEKVEPTLQSKTTNGNNSAPEEEISKINGAIQEMGEKELQYRDDHDC